MTVVHLQVRMTGQERHLKARKVECLLRISPDDLFNGQKQDRLVLKRGGKDVSLRSISLMFRMNQREVSDQIEPWLDKKGLIDTPLGGRCLTEKGVEMARRLKGKVTA